MHRRRWKSGFTLAELLVSLAILGVIATFAIPKVLNSQQDRKYNAIAKEAAGALAEMHGLYNLNSSITTATRPHDLLVYLNYVGTQTSGVLDDKPGTGTRTCTAGSPCYLLANGAAIRPTTCSFDGTAVTNAVTVVLDPDIGTSLPDSGIEIFIYFNGRITTRGTVATGTENSCATYNPDPSRDPAWFNW